NRLSRLTLLCFFFQAEDGIRDWSVTGVQTCALPIYHLRDDCGHLSLYRPETDLKLAPQDRLPVLGLMLGDYAGIGPEICARVLEIGRASCRERGWSSVVAGSVKKRRTDGKKECG